MERVFQSYDLTKELKSKTEFIGQYIDLCEEKDNLLNMEKKKKHTFLVSSILGNLLHFIIQSKPLI